MCSSDLSCVKGRFAWGYANHKERILNPMIRESIDQPWREVSWDEAIAYTASEFKRIQAKYGRGAIGGITSSRCTNEETYLVQKLIRGGFGNNNVDTCARVCHSPTGYGLSKTYGTSAGTQNFDSVEHTDVALIIGANPVAAHPVFASRLKKRLRQGARLIVVDPRRTEMVKSPHVEADYHLALKPGTNAAILNALAHTIVTEGLHAEKFIRERCDMDAFQHWVDFVMQPENSPEAVEKISGVPAETIRGAARLYATGGNGAITLSTASATIKGVEVEAMIQPIRQVELGVNYSHLSAHYKSFKFDSNSGVWDCTAQSITSPKVFAGADMTCRPLQYLSPNILSIYGRVNLPVPESIGNVSLFMSYS